MMEEELKPYLIQRCKLKDYDRDKVTGIDSILSFDYMGSSEFEWGALPKALRELCRVADNLHVSEVSFGKKSLWLICPANSVLPCTKMLQLVANEKHRTKEYVGIEAYLNDDEGRHGFKNYRAWWDIDHAWLACTSKLLARQLIKSIKTVRDRWKKEGTL